MITVCMWSGPRNLSTAMMRSFENRPDCAVWDEPFFAPFLALTGKDHPGREETLAAHDTNPDRVAKACKGPAPGGADLFFLKHMPHHLVKGIDQSWANAPHMRHFMLIRHPAAVIASYAKGRAKFTVEDIGLTAQWEYFQRFSRKNPVPVVDSADILRDPEGQLRALCAALGIEFYPEMLSWPAGPRESDGAWAPYWYKNVVASTGFGAPREALPNVSEEYAEIYAQSWAAYKNLAKNKL